ncbi:MAG: alkaline phosphatase D family protein [Pirellulales bacterium]
MSDSRMTRRRFQRLVAQLSVAAYAASGRSSYGLETTAADPTEDRLLPNITSGVMSGDVTTSSAVIWSRADRESRMIVELAGNDAFQDARKIPGPDALTVSDFTAKLRLNGLTPGETYFYRVTFQDLHDLKSRSAPVIGRFKTPPTDNRDISFAWSGDTAGQGYGIDPARGGMRTFAAIRKLQPDFFVNSGDVIYADNPIESELKLDDGSLWKNVTIEGKHKVAETLEEFRTNYRYNLMDSHLRSMNAEVPCYVQWDDHETLNNWYPGEILDDARYKEKSVSLLAARGRRAFFDYLPIRTTADGPARMYRSQSYGPLCELFFIDLRTYRGPNSFNRQTEPSPATAYLGKAQLEWLKTALRQSKAVWKVICSDMPIGLVVGDGKDKEGRNQYEASANGDGPALGRELEIADLLSAMKRDSIKNTVWLTADVHYAASHYYDPAKAVFQDFDPFWEFVSGPLHAGTFGPGVFDNTFGPQLKFKSIPDGMKGNRPPSDGFQFFGHVKIDGRTKALTVTHYDAAGKNLWSIELPPADI